MKHLGKLFLLMLLVGAFSSVTWSQEEAKQQKTLFHQVPQGWRAEIIPFPLGFAPEIDLRGHEELQFSPGMFQADAEDFFSYLFIWWLEGRVPMDEAYLEKNLLVYFQGLYNAVSKQENKVVDDFEVTVRKAPPEPALPLAEKVYRGKVHWREPFATEKEMDLHFLAGYWFCEKEQRTSVYFMLSPRTQDHPIWATMKTMSAGHCQSQ